MNIRTDVLQSTLEHVQLDFEINKKYLAASVKLDTKNLTRDEISLLREIFGLEPITEWYPKIMREIILWETFIHKTSPQKEQAQKAFNQWYSKITGVNIDEAWWSDKSQRPKANHQMLKAWALSVLAKAA